MKVTPRRIIRIFFEKVNKKNIEGIVEKEGEMTRKKKMI